MTTVNFDQPSGGTVNSGSIGFAVTNSGSGEAVHANSQKGFGVHGMNGNGAGAGAPPLGAGVLGESDFGHGVHGESAHSDAVLGIVHGQGKTGVLGIANVAFGNGVTGMSNVSNGVHGINGNGAGKAPRQGAGVWGESDNGYGVWGASAHNVAGHFEGDVEVTGDIRLTNQDCAEDFEIADAEEAEPGTVMVVKNDGALQSGEQAYDRRVAGVVSGAGDFRPGIILGRQQSLEKRRPIALLGKVYCKVDAQYAAIEVGDLLTSSPTRGHAMKAVDAQKAFGAAIGKALRPLAKGRGLIPILVTLQ